MMEVMAKDLSIVNCFRCYIEINDSVHRIVIKDADKCSSVKLDLILKQFNGMNGKLNINFNTHEFQILSKKTKRFEQLIRYTDIAIENADKIVIKTKNVNKNSNSKSKAIHKFRSLIKSSLNSKKNYNKIESFHKSLVLIDAIQNLSKIDKTSKIWLLLSNVMDVHEYNLSPRQCKNEFHSLLQRFCAYASDNSFHEPIDGNTLEIYRRIESMKLILFVDRNDRLWIKDQTVWLAVKDTINWILTQTTNVLMDCDYRENSEPSISKERTTTTTLNSKCKLELKTRNPNSKFKRIDSQLVSVILKLELNDRHFFDWTTIRKEMNAGDNVYDTCFLKKQFRQLIAKYISILSRFSTETEAIKEWPLFEKFSKLDLRPFCDLITHQKIQCLRSELSTELNTISAFTQSESEERFLPEI